MVFGPGGAGATLAGTGGVATLAGTGSVGGLGGTGGVGAAFGISFGFSAGLTGVGASATMSISSLMLTIKIFTVLYLRMLR